jgi:hypothetical protein
MGKEWTGNKNTCFAHQPQRSHFLVVYLLVATERPICWVESSKAHLSFSGSMLNWNKRQRHAEWKVPARRRCISESECYFASHSPPQCQKTSRRLAERKDLLERKRECILLVGYCWRNNAVCVCAHRSIQQTQHQQSQQMSKHIQVIRKRLQNEVRKLAPFGLNDYLWIRNYWFQNKQSLNKDFTSIFTWKYIEKHYPQLYNTSRYRG